MQIQRSSNWHQGGGVVAKTDLLIIGIFTAAVSCVGVSQLLFQSGGAMLLILLALLAAAWMFVLWRRPAKEDSEATTPVAMTSSNPPSAMPGRESIAPRPSKRLRVGLIYIAALCGAGVVVTGGTMGTVVLVAIAVLAIVGALNFLIGTNLAQPKDLARHRSALVWARAISARSLPCPCPVSPCGL